MSLPDVVIRVRSGVVHIVWVQGSTRISSGSGFFIKDHLITNYHVALQRPAGCDCVIRFSDDPPDSGSFKFSPAEIDTAVKGASDQNGYDFAILHLPALLTRSPYQFDFAPADRPRMGQSVAFLGYPLDLPHLSCHGGIVSAVYLSHLATLIQVDASINPSNSGGPLIEAETGAVLGLISRRETGLSKMFDELIQTFDKNLELLNIPGGRVSLLGVDPIRAFRSSQIQMKQIARELQRSANVGIGWAIKADALRNEPALQ